MLIDYKLGTSSVIIRVKIRSTLTGLGLTGLTSASSGLRIAAIADDEAATTAYTAAGSTIETIATLGTFAAPTATKCRFKEVDSTNHPGVYEVQLDNARYAVASAKSMMLSITGATNAFDCDVLIPLRSVDPYDAVRFGLTALPNANAAASGGLPTVDGSNGVKLSVGTGAGQLNLSSGKAPATLAAADVTGNLGAAITTIGDTRIANLDATVSSRSTYAGGAVASVTGPVALDLTQAIPTTNTAQTMGDALNAARAQGFGKWVRSGTTLTLYAADGTTVVRTFTLDSATVPTSRT